MSTGSFDGKVQCLKELQAQEESRFGPGNYMPNIRLMYWSMRVMAYLGMLMFLVAAVGALLYWKKKLEGARWFLWAAVFSIALPYVAATAGWVLTEMGRQPWIVQGLLKTEDAVSPTVSAWTVGVSLGVFAGLYGILAVVDFVLMRRYARVDPPDTAPSETDAVPALGY